MSLENLEHSAKVEATWNYKGPGYSPPSRFARACSNLYRPTAAFRQVGFDQMSLMIWFSQVVIFEDSAFHWRLSLLSTPCSSASTATCWAVCSRSLSLMMVVRCRSMQLSTQPAASLVLPKRLSPAPLTSSKSFYRLSSMTAVDTAQRLPLITRDHGHQLPT